jgi:hypothetical protein
MTYFIIRDTLIIICLFYYLHKKLNKTDGELRNLKIKNDTFNRLRKYGGRRGSCWTGEDENALSILMDTKT